jgi:predicted HicB family RNase H-like nuclease
MNIVINEDIAPEVARAIIAQAAHHGLSVNDYLRQLLGLEGSQAQEEPGADTTVAQ